MKTQFDFEPSIQGPRRGSWDTGESAGNEVFTEGLRQVEGQLVDEQQLAAKRQLRQLAWLLDESIEIPGVKWRIGIDGLLGLIPGIGDLISTGLSAVIIRNAAQLGVPKIVLARMTLNSLLDFAVGTIPLAGDLFDFAWKANRRNAQLALQHTDAPRRTSYQSWVAMGGFMILAAGVLLAVGSLVALLLSAIF